MVVVVMLQLNRLFHSVAITIEGDASPNTSANVHSAVVHQHQQHRHFRSRLTLAIKKKQFFFLSFSSFHFNRFVSSFVFPQHFQLKAISQKIKERKPIPSVRALLLPLLVISSTIGPIRKYIYVLMLLLLLFQSVTIS